MQRLADQLVGDVRAVEVAGVDVVHAARHRLAQHGERRVAILGRTEDAGPGELHRAVAHAVHGAVAERERAGCGRCAIMVDPPMAILEIAPAAYGAAACAR